MKDVEKRLPDKKISAGRRRNRKRSMSVYYFLVFSLVFSISAVISLTVLFSVEKIEVEGEIPYSGEEIIEVSGLEYGENLIRAKAKAAEEILADTFLYIESVSVRKKFPNTIVIEAEKCVPYFNIQTDSGYLMVSRKGKILDCLKSPVEGLIEIKGFDAESFIAGNKLQSTDVQKLKILLQIADSVEKYNISDIHSADLTDIYSIKLSYDNRVMIEAGSFTDIDYKLNFANEVLTDSIGDTKEGYLLINDDSASFVTKEEMEQYRQNKGV